MTYPSAPLAPAHEVDWASLRTHVRAHMLTALEADAHGRKQRYDACRILREDEYSGSTKEVSSDVLNHTCSIHTVTLAQGDPRC
jgi:hypothetical protein